MTAGNSAAPTPMLLSTTRWRRQRPAAEAALAEARLAREHLLAIDRWLLFRERAGLVGPASVAGHENTAPIQTETAQRRADRTWAASDGAPTASVHALRHKPRQAVTVKLLDEAISNKYLGGRRRPQIPVRSARKP